MRFTRLRPHLANLHWQITHIRADLANGHMHFTRI